MKKITSALSITFLFFLSLGMSAKTEQPNVIFILIDDMGYSDLTCYGSDLHETPNIDKLGQSGMIFWNGYAAGPVCTPTRASIMSGKPPVSVGLTEHIRGREFKVTSKHALIPPENGRGLALEETTIAEVLKEQGYATGMVGKWHLGNESYSADKQGFDYVLTADKQTGAGKVKIEDKIEYRTDWLTKNAINFVDDNKKDPFFLYLSYYAVHIPLWAKGDLLEKYKHKIEDTHPTYHKNAHYAAMIETLDNNIGYLMDHLKKEGLLENTLIILTSDNGGLSVKEGAFTPATNNYPCRAGKGHLYEGGVKEPLMVSWPGKVKANTFSNYPVISYDFLTTISAVCGVKKETPGSVDISPIFLSQKKLADRPIFWYAPHYSNQGGKPAAAVRMGKYKLIRFLAGPTQELYNLEQDKSEQIDLSTELPEVCDSLSILLDNWLEETNAKLPVPNPEFVK